LNLYTYSSSSSSSSSCVDPSATRRTTFASVLLICIN
jgi:predicted lipoprotein with Yx(FWY)xxD motif